MINKFRIPLKKSNFISIIKTIWTLLICKHKKHVLITDDTQFGYKVYLEAKTEDNKPCGYLQNTLNIKQ